MTPRQYNTPKYTEEGNPICEICGLSYKSISNHVKKRHGLSAIEYKDKYGLHPRKGLESQEVHKKRRKAALKNKANFENLIVKGKKTRFEKGNRSTPIETLKVLNKERMLLFWFQKKYLNQWNSMSDLTKEVLIARLKYRGAEFKEEKHKV